MYIIWLEGPLWERTWLVHTFSGNQTRELNWVKIIDVVALLGNTVLFSIELPPNKSCGWG